MKPTELMIKSFCFFLLGTVCFLLPAEQLSADPGFSPNTSMLDELTIPSTGRSKRSSSTDSNIDSNGDSKEIFPGQTIVIADLKGPGIIKHIWNTSASLNPYSLRALVIRIYWDGSEKPSVEVPLGDFFGVGHGTKKDFQSMPVGVSSFGRSRTCFWRMPFNKSAKVTISNELPGFGPAAFYYYVDWEKVESLPKEILYFHARYHQQAPAKPGDHVILDTKGKGNYIGTVYSALQVKSGWFGEGDDRFFIDGEKVPSIQGTGTEDYFGDAWGFREFAGMFHGVTLYEGVLAGDRVTAYRWHIPDPIRFEKSLKFSMEHRGSVFDRDGNSLSSSGERVDWVSSVAFWYQTPITFSEVGLPPAKERVPPYRIKLASTLKMKATPDKAKKDDIRVVYFQPETGDGEIEFEFDVNESGTYKFSAILADSVFGSRYQPMLDGKPAGPVLDMNSKGGDWSEYVFGVFKLEKGKHAFKLKGKGASPNMRPSLPPKFAVGISSLMLLRLEDLEK